MALIMSNPQGFHLYLPMAHPLHYLLLLSLSSKCSQPTLLSLIQWWRVLGAWFRIHKRSAMAPVVRVEPYELTLLDSNPGLLQKVRDVGWLPFLERFSDSNPEVTRVFALSLVNYQAEVGDLCFRVDERSVANATGLPLSGQKWFKYQRMEITEWRSLLKNPTQDVSFRTGVARKYFLKDWRPVLDLIHRYLTCEGRLSSTYVYHLRLMAAFIGFPINLPYYLLHSLFKMSNAIKKGPKHVSHSLFHHGLVRMLIENELMKSGRSWEQFIEANGFSGFCHCMFDSPDDCNKHRVSGSTPLSKSTLNPKSAKPSQAPVCNSKDDSQASLQSRRVKKSPTLSPVTPSNSSDKDGNRRGNLPKSKLGRRLTRSMLKAKVAQNRVNDKLPVETIVIDDEENVTRPPVNDDVVHCEFVANLAEQSNPAIVEDIFETPSLSVEVQPVEPGVGVTFDGDSPPSVDKKVQEVQADCTIDSVEKEKFVKTTSDVPRVIGETFQPLFISCLLDRVRRMEEKMNEIVASRDLLKVDNAGLKVKVDESNQHLSRLRNHKNKLIRRVLKLQDANEKSEEKLRELNAQIALMQFKTPSPSQSSGVNIQVFNAPVGL